MKKNRRLWLARLATVQKKIEQLRKLHPTANITFEVEIPIPEMAP